MGLSFLIEVDLLLFYYKFSEIVNIILIWIDNHCREEKKENRK